MGGWPRALGFRSFVFRAWGDGSGIGQTNSKPVGLKGQGLGRWAYGLGPPSYVEPLLPPCLQGSSLQRSLFHVLSLFV